MPKTWQAPGSARRRSRSVCDDHQNVSLHIKNVACRRGVGPETGNRWEVQNQGPRNVQRKIQLYRLEMILAVGSASKACGGVPPVGHHLPLRIPRQRLPSWTTTPQEPWRLGLLDELLARIREIRASEKRFYQKVRDLFALSADYRAGDRSAEQFFAEVQNKLLYAVTKRPPPKSSSTAPGRRPNMGLVTWSGNRVRKQDVIVARNYLC